MTAKEYIRTLELIAQEYTGSIPRKEIFALSKRFLAMPIEEISKLIKAKDPDLRLSAVSILDWKARNKNTSLEEKKKLCDTYLKHHNWIDNWGMVDRAAPYVVGGYLFYTDRKALYQLAKSTNPMERRTAIVSTYYFIRKDDLEDTFKLAKLLVHDDNEYVQKAVGSWVREAGKRDEVKLKAFLNEFASTMPRVMLRYAIEKLNSQDRTHYLGMKE